MDDELELRLSAIACAERRVLLAALRERPGGATITALADDAGLSRFAASHRLAILRRAGLVRMVRDGNRRLHSIELDSFLTIDDWVWSFVSSHHDHGVAS